MMNSDDRLAVRKTHKLFIGGAFPRSESGRTTEVTDHEGAFLANVAMASRKDARDSVIAARTAFAPGQKPRPITVAKSSIGSLRSWKAALINL